MVGVETNEIALDFRNQPLSPPIQEVVGVIRQRPPEIGADLPRIRRINRRAAHIVRPVFGSHSAHVRLCWNCGSINISVDDLDEPVGSKRSPEPAEHIVATQPPAANVCVHRRDGIRDVQVIVDPEQFLLPVLPLYWKFLVAKESGIHDFMTHTELSGRFFVERLLIHNPD